MRVLRNPSLTAVVLVLALNACSSSGATPTGRASSSGAPAQPSSTADHPIGVIAMGHSGLTGEGTGDVGMPRLAGSWATGDAPDVNSVYLRLVAARPETKLQVANTAHGAASASELVDQSRAALAKVPYPALAIVSTIDQDIRCDGTDDAHVGEFGTQVKAALDLIHMQSPNTKILVVGQFGRPSVDFIQQLVAAVPSQRAALSGPGICDFFAPDGTLQKANFATLTGIIDAYEAEQARVCAEVPNCATDGGVRKAYVDKLENFSPDYQHLNVKGQAAQAELMWPVVEKLLGL